jgi:multiple antibiotic resistance protein
MGFFAIMNPIANTPIFLGVTADDVPAIRKQVAMKAVVMAFGIILVFCLLGKLIFSLFGITLPAFRITGDFGCADRLQHAPR